MNRTKISCSLIARPRNKCVVKAFTLLEMSIVIAIIATILAGGMVIFTSSLQKKQMEETQAKLATIQKALLDYRRAFNRIPCPTNINAYNTSDSNFGVEAANAGTCTGGTPAANYTFALTGHNIVAGMVPTKTLRLPDEYAFDGWGRRILYAVDTHFTATDAFLTGATTSSITYDTITSPNYPRIKILYAAGSFKTESAAYALVSFGPNGHGAYGRLAGSRITAGSTNTPELENCDCTAAAANGTFDNEFYQLPYQPDSSDPQNVFDDIVVYATRADLRSGTE